MAPLEAPRSGHDGPWQQRRCAPVEAKKGWRRRPLSEEGEGAITAVYHRTRKVRHHGWERTLPQTKEKWEEKDGQLYNYITRNSICTSKEVSNKAFDRLDPSMLCIKYRTNFLATCLAQMLSSEREGRKKKSWFHERTNLCLMPFGYVVVKILVLFVERQIAEIKIERLGQIRW